MSFVVQGHLYNNVILYLKNKILKAIFLYILLIII